MSRALITESYLTGIANAIRAKLGVQSTYTPPQMAAAIESIPTGGITPTGTKNITQNGTHDVTQYASANVNVPNSYAAGDEGKVVSNGALVAQTSRSVTANGTYDTTTNDEVVVSVTPNLQSKTVTENGTVTPDQGYDGLSRVEVNVSGGGAPDRTKINNLLVDCYTRQGWIGGFYSSNAVMQPQNSNYNALDVDWASAFKMHLKIKLINTKTGSQALYGPYQLNAYQKTPTCEIQGTSKFWFGFTTNGSSWTNGVDITEIPIVQNGVYEITRDYNGSKIDITVTDGTNVAKRTITPSGALYHSSSYNIGFGNIARNSSLYSNYVYFDPDNSYIESNGTLVWGARPS